VPSINALLVAGLIWQLVVTLRRARTIRARLLTVSIGTVLLTAAAIGTATILIGFQNGREQAIDRLELVASLRMTEIDNWVSDVRDRLAGSLQQAPEHRFVEPDVASVVAALIDMPADSSDFREAYGFLRYNFQQWMKQAEGYDLVFFMDRNGQVIVSSDPSMEGQSLGGEAYFNKGTVGSYMAPPRYDEATGGVSVYASRPILGEYGRLLGVLAGRVDASRLDRVMRMREQVSLGESGETYLVSGDYRMLTNSRFAAAGTRVDTESVRAAVEREEEGAGTYVNYQGDSVIGVYRWVPDLEVVLVAEQSRAEAFSVVNRTAMLNAGIALVAVLIAGAISMYVASDIGDPLSDLAETASGIAAGDLERTASVNRADEIGTLADAFNTMTVQLRGLIGRLEERVAERTKELEIRSSYLEASAEVGKSASTMLDADDLIQSVVDLIHDRFDLYYVGLFLLDQTGESAELRAGTGEAGRKMLLQGHSLRVGGKSMIGRCIERREARIALDVGEEAVRFENPLLPKTRSEAALPLQSRGRVFGAITVQSERAVAFDQDTVIALQTMADQVAVALDNAYLFAEAQESLQAARRATAATSREGWAELLQLQRDLGYQSDERGVLEAGGAWRPEAQEALRCGTTVLGDGRNGGGDGETASGLQPLAVPIKVAGEVIGVVSSHKPRQAGPWLKEEVETLESLVEEMAVSLESARLYQETQMRAAREQMVAEITGRLRSSLDPDMILRTTVRELGRALETELTSVEITGWSVRNDGHPGAGDDRAAGPREE
jgi:GAF domain-containing protein/HAMP domain-containing protein